MLKFITFAKLTEKGQMLPPDKSPATLAKVQEIVNTYGGKLESMWATSGKYDFISVAAYPDEISAFKARTKITELGLFHLDSTVIFPIESFMEAVADKKVLLTV